MLPAEIKALVAQAHDQQQIVVLVTGVFDLLHEEHIRFLQKAKAIGDVLIIGIESDARVRKIKGEGRPVHNQQKRYADLLALNLAQGVFVLPEQFSRPEDHDLLIKLIRPHFLAVSSHSPYQVEKAKILEKYGGQVRVVHEHNPAVSTTRILEKRKMPST